MAERGAGGEERNIADLQAQVARLETAHRAAGPGPDASDDRPSGERALKVIYYGNPRGMIGDFVVE